MMLLCIDIVARVTLVDACAKYEREEKSVARNMSEWEDNAVDSERV